MVTKCANPECSSQFRYLHLGKLFMIESGGAEHKLDYYWLCEKCCSTLTIERKYGKDIAVTTTANRARSAQSKDSFRAA
jgi:hypothetical protein